MNQGGSGGAGGWGSGGGGFAEAGESPPPGGFGAPAGFAPPPAGYPPGYDPGGVAPGAVEPLSGSDPIAFAWDRVKADPGTIIGAVFVGMLVGQIPGILCNVIAGAVDEPAINHAGTVLGTVVGAFMAGGLTRFSLNVARGAPAAFGDVFRGGRHFLPILGANLLMMLGVFGGLLLFIVPAFILAAGWMLTLPIVVDRDLGPIDAMKESWRLTTGYKGTILTMLLLLVGLTIAGLCACGVGILVVYPIMYIADAYLYLRLTGQPTAPMTAR